MKRLIFLFLTIVFCFNSANVFSQMSGGFSGSIQNMINLNQMIGLPTDALGKDPYIDIKGSPFFYEFFSDCYIQLNNGESYIGPKIKFNLTNQKLHYQGANSQELVLQDGIIKRFNFNVPYRNESISYTFACGYPPIAGNTINTFYQEFNVGTATLLRFISKKVVEHKTTANINPFKEFMEVSTYYISNSRYNKFEKWRKGKDFILDFLSDKRGLVEKFIADNNLSCKSPEDIIIVVQYYNNLKAE